MIVLLIPAVSYDTSPPTLAARRVSQNTFSRAHRRVRTPWCTTLPAGHATTRRAANSMQTLLEQIKNAFSLGTCIISSEALSKSITWLIVILVSLEACLRLIVKRGGGGIPCSTKGFISTIHTMEGKIPRYGSDARFNSPPFPAASTRHNTKNYYRCAYKPMPPCIIRRRTRSYARQRT